MPRVVALVGDLMDRSRLSTALPDVVFSSDVASCAAANVIVIDLARHGGLVAAARATTPGARIVAFGPHVDDDLLAAARADGADVVLSRMQFFRDPTAAALRDI
jgi:hypothetical protein